MLKQIIPFPVRKVCVSVWKVRGSFGHGRDGLWTMNRLRAITGGIAQLAEHELCKLGVAGSTPVASTSLRSERSRERRLPRRS